MISSVTTGKLPTETSVIGIRPARLGGARGVQNTAQSVVRLGVDEVESEGRDYRKCGCFANWLSTSNPPPRDVMVASSLKIWMEGYCLKRADPPLLATGVVR